MYNYKISVILPIYNVEQYLKRCINSILAQTFTDFEILCVNDCSPDNSADILEAYAKKYPDKIKIINNEENMGLGATRDNGLKHAQGEYIAFIDSDDYIKKDYLETFYEKAVEENADMVTGGYIILNGDKKTYLHKTHDKHSKWLWPSAWAKLYKHDFLKENNLDFRGTRIYEDEPFTYRVNFKQPVVATVNYCGYYYVMNATSITQSVTNDRYKKFYRYIISTKKLIKEAPLDTMNKYDHDIFEFSIMAGLIANALFNGQSSGASRMVDIRKECFEIMDTYFPNYMRNPYFHLWKLPKLEFKKRYCTWLIIFTRRIKLDKLLFKIVGKL